MTTRHFRYQLDALLRKRTAELEQLRHEQAVAKTRVDACTREVDAVTAAIIQGETRLRTGGGEGSAIDMNAQARTRSYLKVLHMDRDLKRQELMGAQREYDNIGMRLRIVHEGIKALERHREERRAGFNVELQRQDQAAIDELWLLRRPGNW